MYKIRKVKNKDMNKQSSNSKSLKNSTRGITLIALVITIIVLLILAGVTIATLTGDNGILTRANEAKEETKAGEDIEKIKMAVSEAQMGEDGYQELTTENLGSEIIKDGTKAVVSDNEDGTKHILFLDEKKEYSLDNNGNIEDLNIDFDTKYVAPASQDEERNEGVIGIGTDGNPVDMDLWEYTLLEDGTYCLNTKECINEEVKTSGYLGDIIKGTIIGSIPQYIYNGKWIEVTSLYRTFQGNLSNNPNLIKMTIAPDIPSTITRLELSFGSLSNLNGNINLPNSIERMYYTFAGCSALQNMPTIPNSVKDMEGAFYKCISITKTSYIPDSVIKMSNTFNRL